MKHRVVLIGGMFLAWPAIAQPRFPDDVTRFIERRDACDHFRGEAPYDAARRKFLEEQALRFCPGTDAQLAELKKKYRSDKAITTKLDEYEPDIEPPQK
jgi:hypothetical protein